MSFEIKDVGPSTEETVEQQYRDRVKLENARYPFTWRELRRMANDPAFKEWLWGKKMEHPFWNPYK